MDIDSVVFDSSKNLGAVSKKLKQTQDTLASDAGIPSSSTGHVNHADTITSSTSYSDKLNNIDCSDSDFPYQDDGDNNDAADEDEDDLSFFGDDCDSISDHDGYAALQSQFDNVDLPPGVEASFSWFSGPSASATETLIATNTLTISDLHTTEGKENATIGAIDHAESSSNSKVESKRDNIDHAESSSNSKVESKQENSVPEIPRFDVVDGFSDHHYATSGFKDTQPPKNWAKKIQEEWKILQSDLPETIFVRVCEARLELLRAVLVGPSGTPYHDGLFVFDCLFPTDYPNSPPSVYYYSGGLRLNPNLYDCGKVCLSLLGTWDGTKDENWIPEKSTMLQVLVSIQALILNEKPFFNEPGYECFTGKEGELRSNKYNEDVFVLSLKTMIYTLRRPPKHFEDLVVHHFRARAHNILAACKAYVEFGSYIDPSNVTKEAGYRGSNQFKSDVTSMIDLLIRGFSRNGTQNCEGFRVTTRSD